jgi:ATP-dependent RNA helicase DDX1
MCVRVCVHAAGAHGFAEGSAEMNSEAIKRLKSLTLKRVIEAHKMDQAIIFVRTRLDADNVEKFLQGSQGTAHCEEPVCIAYD